MKKEDYLFVVYKPIFISTNNFVQKIRKKFNFKKCGFSGTLDLFACGNVVVACGKYTKLFNYLQTSPKVYKATIFLGAQSDSLDIEKVTEVTEIDKIEEDYLEKIISNLKGKIEYIPPKFSAKKIDGQRAYKLAREGIEFQMRKSVMHIYDIKLIAYHHPFVTINVTVSKGAYIRSICEMLSNKLKIRSSLSYLNRLKEGNFVYNNGYTLNPLEYMDLKVVKYYGKEDDLNKGLKLSRDKFEKNLTSGLYIVECGSFFAILKLDNENVKYIMNKVSYAYTIKEGRRKYSYR